MAYLYLRVLTGVSCAAFLLAGCGTSETASTTDQDDSVQTTVPEELAFVEEEAGEEEVLPTPQTEESVPEAETALTRVV